jgi:tetratricopeptide (TPR) repeat protein
MSAYLALSAVARSDDPPSKPEDKPSEVASPSPEQLARITKTARRIMPSVFTVGRPNGIGASAFLISRKERLLATAAHVAEHYQSGEGPMLAIPNDTATSYRVDRVYFHPGTVRELDGGLFARSDDPNDGAVDQLHGPDVAVLHLADGGPELPDELPLATVEEIGSLDDRALGLLGYPSERADGWPTTRRPAWATLALGIFSSTNDKAFSGLLFPRQQRFWVSASLEQGSSGGLVFLDNGHVAGIISGGTRDRDNRWATRCTRVDALVELLRQRCLADFKLDPLDVLGPHLKWENDPRLPKFREAVGKIRIAEGHRQKGEYQVAGRLCNEVIEAFPSYSYAVLERSWVYSDYCDEEWERLSVEERARFARWASDDSLRCIKAANTNSGLPYVIQAKNYLLIGRSLSRGDYFEATINYVDGAINDWPLDQEKTALAYHIRARAHHYQGNLHGAEGDFAEAIRYDPEEPRWLLGRAKFNEERGKTALAVEDRRKAEELRLERRKAEEMQLLKLPIFRSTFDIE